MDYEKKYKETIAWIDIIMPTLTKEQQEDALENFPELAESEDERIRKEMITAFSRLDEDSTLCGVAYNYKKWIAWLEKQGQTFTKKDVDDAYLKGVFDTKQGKHDARYKYLEEIIAADDIYQMAMNDAMVNEAKEKAAKALSELCIGKLLGFEKQGEQKPADKSISKEEILYQLVQNGTITEFDYLYLTRRWNNTEFTKDFHDIDPHFGIPADKVKSNLLTVERAKEISPFMRSGFENEYADKVEPKFKNGQWIVWQDKCYKVNYNGCGYELVDQNGLSTSLEYGTVDTSARLYDVIKDAKDGDVLCWDESKCIALFKNIDDKESFNSYGCVGHCTGKFESGLSYHDIEGAHPATKEQRDTLMKAMADAGYEFDFEKKELKKIEKKPIGKPTLKFKVGDMVCKKKDNSFCATINSITDTVYLCDVFDSDGDYDDDYAFLISEQDEYELVAKKIEDEIEIPFGAKDSELIEERYYIPKGFHAEIEDDKVVIKKGEKPAEWSEEDETGLTNTIIMLKEGASHHFIKDDITKAVDWLKTLKDRVSWKPNKKQMETLEYYMHTLLATENKEVLFGLYNYLKKL